MATTELPAVPALFTAALTSSPVVLFALAGYLVGKKTGRHAPYHALSVLAVPACALLALVLHGDFNGRQTAVTGLLSAWAARLAIHLYTRAAAPACAGEFSPVRAATPSLMLTRATWALAIAAPAVLLNREFDYGTHPGIFHHSEDAPAIAGALAALSLEAWSDTCKRKSHALISGLKEAPPAAVLARGPWRWSRHPNWFAEVSFHLCIYALCIRHVPHLVAISPAYTTLACIFAQGGLIDYETRLYRQTYTNAALRAYRRTTSPFIPLPPGIYERLPVTLQTAVLFERAFTS